MKLAISSVLQRAVFVLAVSAALSVSAFGLGVEGMSFERAEPGALSKLVEVNGVWTAKPGHAEITGKFAKRGKQSLRIFGGDRRMVEFTPAADRASLGGVNFHAERWTVRGPFAFSVEALVAGEWSEIYNGDKEIKVGARFLSQVGFPLPPHTERLRFICTAPEGGGVLIDSVRVFPARIMAVQISAERPVIPALVGKSGNLVLQMHIDAGGTLKPEHLVGVEVVANSPLIKTVSVKCEGKPFGGPQAAGDLRFEGLHIVRPGRNTVDISVELIEGAKLGGKVGLHCPRLIFKSGVKMPQINPSDHQSHRIGIALRQRGQDKSDAYRIPGLATTNEGTLIAVYDNRYRSGRDLPGDIDVGMSRSTDGGQTWAPMKVIMDMGNDPKWAYDGIGDPAVLVDRKTNTIWVAATWSHGQRSWHGSGPGMKPEETGQFMLVKSEDDGLTWSEPINITAQVKDPKWRFVLAGPGKGITLKDGTLVFPAQFRGENEAPVNGKPFSTLIYSKDRGETWKIGTGVKIDTTEAQLVELGDGSIMINCRDNRGGSRSVYTTKDLGATWQVHPTSRKALPEPVCMASLIRVEHAEHGNLLIFSNPAQTSGRQRMTIKVSNDEGMTWPEKWHTLIDQGGSMYSCMTRIGDDHIGLLYEVPGELNFVRLKIEDLLGDGR